MIDDAYDNLVDRLADLRAGYAAPARSAPNSEWVDIVLDLRSIDEEIADEFYDLIDDINYYVESRGG